MKGAKIAMMTLAALTVLGAAGAVWGQSLDEFFIGPDIYPSSYTDDVIDLKVTPDDRWVVLLRDKSLRFIDTWNFSVLAGDTGYVQVASGTGVEAVSLAISPDGKFAFVGTNDGYVKAIKLTPLSGLLPGEEPATVLAVTDEVQLVSGATIAPMTSVMELRMPSMVSGTTVFVLMGSHNATASALDGLYFGYMSGNTLFTSTAKNLHLSDSQALARGNQYAFELNSNGLSTYLYTYYCSSSTCKVGDSGVGYRDLGGNSFTGLDADHWRDAYAITTNNTTHELWSIDTPLAPIDIKDALATPAATDLVILPTGSVEPVAGTQTDVVITAPAASPAITVNAIAWNDLTFDGSTALPGNGLYSQLTSSSTVDGYVYAANGNTVAPVTANPWILMAAPLSSVTVTDSFTVQAVVLSDSDTVVVGLSNSQVFRNWGTLFGSTTVGITPGDSALVSLAGGTANLPKECENILTVVATDKYGREGRTAVTLNKDTVPAPLNFDVGFGDRKIIYSFTVPNLCDLASVEVYYATSPTGISTYADLQTLATLDGTYTTAGDVVDTTISGLTNFNTYYVWVVVLDENHQTISGPQSATTQPVYTLTDLTDEDGGVTCFGSVVGSERGSGWGMALLAMPLFLGGGLMWWKRRGEVKK